MLLNFARNCPGGALSPCPNGYGCGKDPYPLQQQQQQQQQGLVRGVACPQQPLDAGFGWPLPPLPPIVTRKAADSSSVPTPMPMPGLKIRTPRRHFGTAAED
jgi:hypothetical protein